MKLTDKEFSIVYRFLASRNILAENRLEALTLAMIEIPKLDLKNHFGSFYDDIDERRVYSFLCISFDIRYNSTKAIVRKDIGNDEVLVSEDSLDVLDNTVNCVIKLLNIIYKNYQKF